MIIIGEDLLFDYYFDYQYMGFQPYSHKVFYILYAQKTEIHPFVILDCSFEESQKLSQLCNKYSTIGSKYKTNDFSSQNFIDECSFGILQQQNLTLQEKLQIEFVEEDIINLCNVLKNFTNISALSLKAKANYINQNISQSNVILLSGALELCSNLKYLNLQLSAFCFSDEEISTISSAIVKSTNFSTIIFELSGKKLTQKCVYILSRAFGLCSNLQNLDLIIFSSQTVVYNHHGLISGLEKCFNLKSFQIHKEYLYDICSSLSQCTSLQNLKLGFTYCGLDDDSLSSLELLANCPKILDLDLELGGNKIYGLNEFGLKQALGKYVNLQNLNLNLEQEYFKNSQNTMTFLLYIVFNFFSLNIDRQNPIKNEGLQNLGTTLAQCTNIRSLKMNLLQKLFLSRIQFNFFTIKSMTRISDISQWLLNCQKLSSLDLNLIVPDISFCNVILLCEALELFTNLKFLNLEFLENSITDKGASYLGLSLPKFKNLINLELDIEQNIQFCVKQKLSA
ncbi:hypothetical protein ABPG72_000765 [Tetrahymena utriculariae]